MAWSWRSEPAGLDADLPGAADRFESQADAEAWLGLHFAELADAGVRAVTLFEHDRPVYGPMSLEAP